MQYHDPPLPMARFVTIRLVHSTVLFGPGLDFVTRMKTILFALASLRPARTSTSILTVPDSNIAIHVMIVSC